MNLSLAESGAAIQMLRCNAATLPPTQVALARLVHSLMRNPGKPGFRGGEGRAKRRRRGARGGGTKLALNSWPPPTPGPPPPLATLAGGGEHLRSASPDTPQTKR